MASIYGTSNNVERNNKVGTIESMLSGVASGLIGIPKGFFSLGASIMDLGVNSGKAADVEAWFDNLTEFDEKAEATAAGKITKLLVNIGVPGGVAFKSASGMAKTAMLAGKNKTLFRVADEGLVKAADKALELTAKGKGRAFMAGALGGGIAEGIFIGDVDQAGTFGDLLGGPTAINRSDTSPDATREILNRVKFGTEGAMFTGVLGGVGKVIGKITNRNKNLDIANSKIDRWIDKTMANFRSRSGKTAEQFAIERESIGLRAADANVARNLSRQLDMDIDKIFPPMRTVMNKVSAKERKIFLEEVNDALLSGRAEFDAKGVAQFGEMDAALIQKVRDKIKKLAPTADKADEIEKSIIGSLSIMRSKWAGLFEELGGTLGPDDLKEFQALFGGKFKNYLGSTYDFMQEKSIIPWLRYKPAAEAVENAKTLFKDSFATANPGKTMSDMEAESIVEGVLNSARIPKGLRFDKPSDAIFDIPSFFVNRTALTDATKRTRPMISIGELDSAADKKVFNELLGKHSNPMQTMIGGMAKLSMITRRNVFYNDMLKKSDEMATLWRAADDKLNTPEPMFARSEEEARLFFKDDFRKIDPIDQAQTLTVGNSARASNPFGDAMKPFYARPGVAEALEQTSLTTQKPSFLTQVYNSLVLYPKATSQIAKTILSPVTHLRNFVSAGAFAAANGIIPAVDLPAIKQAYQALQTPLKGTNMQNDLYQKLLKLGVVNSNVRLGDLSRLLKDVNFGETMTSENGMRLLLKPLSKLKSVSQDLYTAEDDFWKIYSWAVEKSRLARAYEKAGVNKSSFFSRNGKEIKLTDDFLDEEAADIIRNNIPNYDYVSDFVKGTRKLPLGNFVSFPAEIARTGTNIVRRALREINETIDITDGAGNIIKTIAPLKGIGYTRLFGFTTTVAAIPLATTAAFQALYDVTDEEREAIRRFAAQWSKNSTLLPIKDENGNFKYIDFSHANAYDTLLRPLQTVVNSVQEGNKDNDGIMDDFAKGVLTSMSEFAQPFISESIWTEAVSDILMRGGRTREGFQVYNDQDNDGDKMSKIMSHLVKAQMPFSLDQLKRLDRSIKQVDVLTKGEYDEYGQNFEFGDELGGLFGFRAIEVKPERTMNFKVADFQRGIRDSRSLFTRSVLKGGPIEPREIVDAYINANRAMFDVKKKLKGDMDAARLLGISDDQLDTSLNRVSIREINAIDDNEFRPYEISREVASAMAENAAAIGASDPFEKASSVIDNLSDQMSNLNLNLPEFPVFENPLMPIMQDTPITPTSLNLPQVDGSALQNQVSGGNFSNLSNQQKFNILFPNG
eukprot:GHVU01125326.1.p1 GENE.GHVU01125326.1~~GHVU01125326.1.p1  ORF type:complete len:1307 (+),score=170.64 GHVU01125326.1:144-4064(+)